MTIYTKQNNTTVNKHASVLSALGARLRIRPPKSGQGATRLTGSGWSNRTIKRGEPAVASSLATGRDASTFNRRGFAIQDHAVTAPDADTLNKRGGAVASLSANSPAPPQPPRGLFCLALNQDTMFQDPVWTVIWP